MSDPADAPKPDPSPVQPHPAVRAVMRERSALALAVLSGVLYFLGFAAFEVLPFAFVSLAPLLVALRGREGWKAVRLGWITGTVLGAGGFYWIVGMLKTFSGFPTALCIVFASLLWAGQGLQFAAFAWVISRLDHRNVPRMASAPLALAAVELSFPLLFPWYTANSLHRYPILFQTADLGGVVMVSWAMALGHTALSEAWVRAGTWRERLRPALIPLAFWAFAIPYGAWRIAQTDAEAARSRALRVGVVQQNLGLMEKRNDAYESLRRHLTASRELEARGVDLLVWSESAIAFRIPEDVRNIRDYITEWDLRTPVLFGALSVRDEGATRMNLYNTAFITDATGALRASYDKVYLLAFGEYLPLGETFPQLYQISRNSGHFTPGHRFTAMPVPGGTVAPLICYEDILPRFVRSFMRRTDADLIAVILNDAWFGDTAEPWIHDALAKFRAVEHRRDLIRAANSGVSSIIDATGREVAHTGTFTRESLRGTVHLRKGRTLYGIAGDWVGYIGVLLALYGLIPRRFAVKT